MSNAESWRNRGDFCKSRLIFRFLEDIIRLLLSRVRKKLENRLNRENWKKIIEKTEPKKKRLNFWKNWPVRFGFGFISKKPKKLNRTETDKKPKKTEPNWKNQAKPKKPSQNQKKPSQTGLNRFCPKKTKPNRNRSVWPGFDSVSVFF